MLPTASLNWCLQRVDSPISPVGFLVNEVHPIQSISKGRFANKLHRFSSECSPSNPIDYQKGPTLKKKKTYVVNCNVELVSSKGRFTTNPTGLLVSGILSDWTT